MAQGNEAVIVEHRPEAGLVPWQASSAITPMAMVDRAVSQGASVEVVAKMMELQERWQKNQARMAFDEAMAAAKAEIPVIFKNRTVDFTSQKGRTNYRHEDLAEIARTVDPILGKHGLSYRFNTKTDPGIVTVTCILSHRNGHFEENALSAGHDVSGNKNSIQAIGSTITYLQRYTLKAALGLAASADDDGKTADEHSNAAAITDEQVDEISKLLTETKSNLVLFLKKMKIEGLTEIRTDQFDGVMALIRETAAKRAAREAAEKEVAK